MKLKRILALGLTLVLTAGVLPACGKKEETKITNVFKQTDVKLPDEYSNNWNFSINQLYKGGDGVYAMCWYYDDKTYNQRQFLLPIGTDGSCGSEIDLGLNLDENVNSYLQSLCFSGDGSFWAVIASSGSYEDESGNMMYQQNYALRHYSEPGSDKYDEINIDDMMQPDENGEMFYLNYMVCDDSGNLLLGDWNKVKLMNSSGKITDIDLGDSENMNIQNIFNLDGKLYVSTYSYDQTSQNAATQLIEIDGATGKTGTTHSVPMNMSYNLISGPDYDYYYNDNTSVWGCKFDSEERVELLNFINSDINSNNINNLIPLSTDRFFMTNYDEMTGGQVCSLLDRIPDDQVAEREIITLATSRLDYDLRNNVISFNRSNDKYRIIVSDYSIYQTDDDWNAGTTRLNSDLVSGKIPDILQINESMPYDSYISKNLFTDLYALMDADESFNRGDYLENIFKAYEVDGKLYSIVPFFMIQTLAAKTENLDGIKHWNVKEFMEFVKNHPDIQIFDYGYNRSSFLQSMMLFSRDSFIDRETGECHFDSDEFKALLEFAGTLTTDNFWENIDFNEVGEDFWNEFDARYAENRVLLADVYFYRLANSYNSMMNYTFKGPFTMVGFPSDNGNGAAIDGSFELAIANRSKHKDGAWEFVKSFFSEEKQMPVETNWGGWNYGSGIPVLKKAIDKQFEIALAPDEDENNGIIGGGDISVMPMPRDTYEETAAADTEAVDTEAADAAETDDTSEDLIDLDGDGIVDGVISAEDTDIVVDEPMVVPIRNNNDKLTQAQADEIRALIEGATQVLRYDEKLNTIITEEAESYFSGQKSLDTVVSIIQNRAETYISESR